MKILRFIGMAVIAVIMSVNFVACSVDDEDIDTAQLEGTWGLTNDEGYEVYEGEKESWNDQYDPANPISDCEKVIISKIADNTYSMTYYDYYNNQWHQNDTEKFTLDGNNLIPVDGGTEFTSVKLLVVNSSQLVVEQKETDEDGDFYRKMTYKRM